MFFKTAPKFLKPPLIKIHNALLKSDYVYEMPEVLKNAFYLANASFFDNTNWFAHRAYEVSFQDLVEEVKTREPSLDTVKAVDKVLDFIKVVEPCNAVLDLRYPVERDGESDHSIIRAFRVQHGSFRAGVPCLGGLTISAEVSKDMMKALAALATYKYACLGIDMKGSHGGIKVCKADYSEKEIKSIVQKYSFELISRGSFGETIDIVEPDKNCGYDEMGWISEIEAKPFDGSAVTRSIVGKPSFCGGLENYENAGAHCILFGLNYFLNHKNVLEEMRCEAGLKNKTFIIQGIGKLGSQIALLLETAGVRCIGVKEHDAYVYNKKGISVKDILDYKNQKGGIEHFSTKTKPRQDNEILTEDCDILVLCAGMKTMCCYTAEKVKAKVIVEAAHGAVTPSAHQILLGHRKLVLPDILITCGFALAGYYEYLKNTQLLSKVSTRSVTKDMFKDLLQNAQRKSKARIVGQSTLPDDVGAFNESKLVFDAMEYIIGQISRDILKKTRKYSLGLDIRTAAYVKSTQNLFRANCDYKSLK